MAAASALRAGRSARHHGDEGYGWVVFAGVMLNVGRHADDRRNRRGLVAHTSAPGMRAVRSAISNPLGWTMMLISAVQVARVRRSREEPARPAGWGPAAAVNAVAQLLSSLPIYPGSLRMFTLDILVMHGLLAYGSRTVRPV